MFRQKVHHVPFAIVKRLFNIYFLNVIMLNSYGEHCMSPLIYKVQQVSMICLQVGYLH
jgi:hypothetical protein